MIYSLFIVALIALVSCSSFVSAWPNGSPICRATSTSNMGSMGATDGSSQGFTLSADSTTYTPGQTITITVSNTDTTKKFRGLLAFVEKSDQSQVGAFSDKTEMQFTSLADPCKSTKSAITQSSSSDKSVPFTLSWTAPSTTQGALTARIVVVGTTNKATQFVSLSLTEGATTTTTAAPGASTTTAAPGASTTTVAPGATTTAKPNSAQQSGPVMMIIGTMMALVMKIIF